MNEFKPAHTIYERQVRCPYCGEYQDETYPEPGGDSEHEECTHCEKQYYAAADIEYRTQRDCKLNGKECEWKLDDAMNMFSDRKYDWFKCPECLETKTTKRVIT